MEQKKVNFPKKGAARKWSKRLEELGNQPPPEDLIKKLTRQEEKIVASPKYKIDEREV